MVTAQLRLETSSTAEPWEKVKAKLEQTIHMLGITLKFGSLPTPLDFVQRTAANCGIT